MLRYRTVFTRQALEFICRASDGEMKELDAWLDRIEAQPGLSGDYAEAGRLDQGRISTRRPRRRLATRSAKRGDGRHAGVPAPKP